jgi:hypothetical protein
LLSYDEEDENIDDMSNDNMAALIRKSLTPSSVDKKHKIIKKKDLYS